MANMSATQVVAVLNEIFPENEDIVTALRMLAHSVAITRTNAKLGLAKASIVDAQAKYDKAVSALEAEKAAAEKALAEFVATLG